MLLLKHTSGEEKKVYEDREMKMREQVEQLQEQAAEREREHLAQLQAMQLELKKLNSLLANEEIRSVNVRSTPNRLYGQILTVCV